MWTRLLWNVLFVICLHLLVLLWGPMPPPCSPISHTRAVGRRSVSILLHSSSSNLVLSGGKAHLLQRQTMATIFPPPHWPWQGVDQLFWLQSLIWLRTAIMAFLRSSRLSMRTSSVLLFRTFGLPEKLPGSLYPRMGMWVDGCMCLRASVEG